MNRSSKAWLLAGVMLVSAVAFGEDKKKEGRVLIERAKQLSDIRTDGAPAFRLKASFKLTNWNSTVTEGTYSETWVSRERWRRETVLGDFRETVVANGKKRWTLENGAAVPNVGDVGFRMDSFSFSPDFWEPDKIEDRPIASVIARCIETKPNSHRSGGVLCFDKIIGTVVTKALPEQKLDRIVNRVCVYGDYQRFGERMFPRSTRCLEDQRPVLEGTVVELIPEPTTDAALFAPLAGGKESPNCQGEPRPPVAVYTPDPTPPRHENPKNPVVLGLIVGTDGKTHDLKVVGSVDQAFDNAATEAVSRWRFSPATCNGQPIETQINVHITFRAY